jgi:hypothetical protein
MSTGALLTVVAVVLAVLIAVLFRLVAVLDSAELALRRLAGDVRAARKGVAAAGELAAVVERDAERGRVAFDRLEALKRRNGGRPPATPSR